MDGPIVGMMDGRMDGWLWTWEVEWMDGRRDEWMSR